MLSDFARVPGFKTLDARVDEALVTLVAVCNPLATWRAAGDPFQVRQLVLTWARERVPELLLQAIGGSLPPAPRPLGWTPPYRRVDSASLDCVLDDVLARWRGADGRGLRGQARFVTRQAVITGLFAEMPGVVERLVAPRLAHPLTLEQRAALAAAQGGK